MEKNSQTASRFVAHVLLKWWKKAHLLLVGKFKFFEIVGFLIKFTCTWWPVFKWFCESGVIWGRALGTILLPVIKEKNVKLSIYRIFFQVQKVWSIVAHQSRRNGPKISGASLWCVSPGRLKFSFSKKATEICQYFLMILTFIK